MGRKFRSVVRGISGYIRILLGLALLAALIFFLNALLASRSSPTANQPQWPSSQQLSPTPISQIDVTANWKIHEDDGRGFNVKYPPDWYLDYPGPRDFFGVTTISNYDLHKVQPHQPLTSSDLKILLYWSFENPLASQTVNSWVQKKAQSGVMSILSSSEMNIGGKSIVYVLGRDESPQGGGNLLRIYYIPQGDRVFIVGATPADSIHQPTLESIIATLEFTN